MKIKKIILIIVFVSIIAGMISLIVRKSINMSKDNDKLQIVVSNFASYDFLRAIIGDNNNIELTFLIGPRKRCS